MIGSVVVAGDGSSIESAVVDALSAVDGAAVERVAGTPRHQPDASGESRSDETPFPTDAGDADALFAVGEAGLLSLTAWTGGSLPPVFPIDTGAGRYDIPAPAVDRAVDAFASGTFETASHPILDVAVGGDAAGSAVADVTLLTTEPARISEYSVESRDGWRETVRADGVVTATPIGSTGYARAAGGPLLGAETGVVTVPISPYAMHVSPWVHHLPVSLSVERDEAAVSLLLDDDVVRQVPPDARVDVRVGREAPVVRPQTIGEW
ncbi:NAD(+)/NADH kinase [Halobellus sp. GM3]|uniref:NAD(+)/NADH kinase n=1 Tax=Halobellus sp. GM3 TaxID=3458410 RepID=UPI00403DB259